MVTILPDLRPRRAHPPGGPQAAASPSATSAATSSISSSESAAVVDAAFSFTWEGEVAPAITEETTRWLANQERARRVRVQPRCSAKARAGPPSRSWPR